MRTNIRPELSTKNKYWIDKHRYYELKHFCLQYGEWKKKYADLLDFSISTYSFDRFGSVGGYSDLTAKYAMEKAGYAEKIKIVEQAAIEADENLYPYILKAVTEDLSYTYLRTTLDMPCSRDMYYDRYRRFFWLLNKSRD